GIEGDGCAGVEGALDRRGSVDTEANDAIRTRRAGASGEKKEVAPVGGRSGTVLSGDLDGLCGSRRTRESDKPRSAESGGKGEPSTSEGARRGRGKDAGG